jgi:hypothetical protein
MGQAYFCFAAKSSDESNTTLLTLVPFTDWINDLH